jgi:ATP-binding cassette subfamily C (CFTR/MRP) protein 1
MVVTFCPEDQSFGPITSVQCRHGLDFTLLFEESFLTILPAALMIIASAIRVFFLRNKRRVVLSHSFYDIKFVSRSLNSAPSLES